MRGRPAGPAARLDRSRRVLRRLRGCDAPARTRGAPLRDHGRSTRRPGVPRDQGRIDELDDLDRELLNAVQWDFPLEPRPFAVLGERLGIAEPEVRERVREGEGRRRAAPAVGDLRHAGARLHVGARRGQGRSRPHRRRRRGHQRASGRQPQLQAQPRVQPLVHGRGAARRLRSTSTSTCCTASRARSCTRKLPTLKLYKIGVKLDMTGQDRGRRQGRSARARAARAQGRDAGARSLRSRARDRSASCRKTCRTSSVRSRHSGAVGSASTSTTCSTRSARSRNASSCAGSPR